MSWKEIFDIISIASAVSLMLLFLGLLIYFVVHDLRGDIKEY